MTTVRSLTFQFLFYAWLAVLSPFYTAMLLGPREWMQGAARLWVLGSLFLLKLICGVRYEVRGTENIPRHGPALVVSKHQSAWDTLIFHHVLPDPIYVLKQELASLPFFGWFVMKSGCVAVDRSAGAKALKQMADGGRAALARGNQVVIFPEGTRTPPGSRQPYHSGVALLYGHGGPTVPVALNSGLFWGRHTKTLIPGTIVIEFLPPLPDDLDRKGFMHEIESRIEAASDRLMAEAIATNPRLKPIGETNAIT